MTDELGLFVALMPDSHSPIIRTSDEDWAVVIVPEGIAANTVDRAHVTIVVGLVPLREGGRALVNRAVLSGYEVVITWVICREVNRETSGVDERHATGLLLGNGTCIYIFLVGIGLTLELF